MTVARVDTVPYANPDCVASAPPVAVMLPLRVRVVVETDDGALVVTVGAVGAAENVHPVLLPTSVEFAPAYHDAPPVTVLLAMLI